MNDDMSLIQIKVLIGVKVKTRVQKVSGKIPQNVRCKVEDGFASLIN